MDGELLRVLCLITIIAFVAECSSFFVLCFSFVFQAARDGLVLSFEAELRSIRLQYFERYVSCVYTDSRDNLLSYDYNANSNVFSSLLSETLVYSTTSKATEVAEIYLYVRLHLVKNSGEDQKHALFQRSAIIVL